MKKLLFSCFLIAVTKCCPAQRAQLEIGDTMPDINLSRIINYPTTNAKLSDFKGRVLVLDFWSTFCTPCIEAFPKYDSLQRRFGDKVQVLLVTYEKEETIRKLWGKLKYLQKVSLPSVTEDTLLHQLFGVTAVPQVVWVNSTGIVSGFTALDYISEDRIMQLLEGGQPNWPVQKLIPDFDYDQPLVKTTPVGSTTLSLPAYSAISSYAPGLKSFSRFKIDTLKNEVSWCIFNQPVKNLYRNILSRLGRTLSDNRILLEVKDSSRYVRPGQSNRTDWHFKNKYCYEGKLPLPSSGDRLQEIFFTDLNRLLGIDTRIEKRSMPCLVVTVKSEKFLKKLAAKTTKGAKTLAAYAGSWNKFSQLPILDETGFLMPVALPYANSIEQLRTTLERHGLQLLQTERMIDMLVISDH